VRDFSPQLGRASAMGFWTLGPVFAGLALAEVSSHTLTHLLAWQDQFTIAGIAGLVIAVIAVVGLRELSPNLRDQLMVSMRDRVLIEARAKGLDIRESLRRPWRQMFHLDIIGSAVAISVLLFFYYTIVAFLTIYLTTIFGAFQTATDVDVYQMSIPSDINLNIDPMTERSVGYFYPLPSDVGYDGSTVDTTDGPAVGRLLHAVAGARCDSWTPKRRAPADCASSPSRSKRPA